MLLVRLCLIQIPLEQFLLVYFAPLLLVYASEIKHVAILRVYLMLIWLAKSLILHYFIYLFLLLAIINCFTVQQNK